MTWNLPSGEAFLPRVSVPELKRRAAKETKARQRTRLLVAVHRKQGRSIDEIAEAVQMHRRSVQDILHRFIERGVGAAESLPKAGRPARLKRAQLCDLRGRLLRPPAASGFSEGFWSTRLVLALVKREYRVNYDASHLRRLLHDLGFSVKTPRPKHYKSSPAEVEAFKKKRGAKSFAQDASGVVNGRREHYSFLARINTAGVLAFIKRLQAHYPRLTVFLDGGPWHRTKNFARGAPRTTSAS